MITKLSFLASILLLISLGFASQDIDIPDREYGFTIGDRSGNLHIEFVMDLLCIDSKQKFALWKDVQKQYSIYENKVKMTYQFNPLPYHFFSVKIHQGFYYILTNMGETLALNYIDYIFENQDRYSEQNNINKTVKGFCDQFAQQIFVKFGVELESFRTALNMGGPSFQKVRNNWKYVAGVLGVPGAPIFYANGVRIDGAEDYTVQQWVSFMKKFQASNNYIRVQ